MKIPKTPPDIKTIVEKDPAKAFAIAHMYGRPLVNGKYLHWDQLRHRNPPDDLSLPEWWFAIKYSRAASSQKIPLLDKKGNEFEYGLVSIIQEALHRIDQKASGRIGVSKDILNEPLKEKYYVSSLIEESITSSQLEGATTTRQIAKEMIRTGRRPQDESERMILNNYVTMQRIHELKDEKMTVELLLEIHRLISKNTMEETEQEGRFRKQDEQIDVYHATSDVVVHVPPPAEELEQRIIRLCKFANGESSDEFVHPIVQSIILHFWIGYVHPFVDGNGRTARALFYWSMLRHGYWLLEFVSISQIILKSPTKYGLAYLYTETDGNDLNYFIIHQLETLLKAITELENYIERKSSQLQLAEKELRELRELNHRQQALILHALKHPHHKYTVKSHLRSHQCSKITARSDLLSLVEKGFLTKGRRGREFVFEASSDLEFKLTGE